MHRQWQTSIHNTHTHIHIHDHTCMHIDHMYFMYFVNSIFMHSALYCLYCLYQDQVHEIKKDTSCGFLTCCSWRGAAQIDTPKEWWKTTALFLPNVNTRPQDAITSHLHASIAPQTHWSFPCGSSGAPPVPQLCHQFQGWDRCRNTFTWKWNWFGTFFANPRKCCCPLATSRALLRTSTVPVYESPKLLSEDVQNWSLQKFRQQATRCYKILFEMLWAIGIYPRLVD